MIRVDFKNITAICFLTILCACLFVSWINRVIDIWEFKIIDFILVIAGSIHCWLRCQKWCFSQINCVKQRRSYLDDGCRRRSFGHLCVSRFYINLFNLIFLWLSFIHIHDDINKIYNLFPEKYHVHFSSCSLGTYSAILNIFRIGLMDKSLLHMGEQFQVRPDRLAVRCHWVSLHMVWPWHSQWLLNCSRY